MRRGRRIGLSLALGCLALVSTPAAAQPAKRASVQKMTSGGPRLDYERFRRQVQTVVAEKREEQIAALKRLLELGAEPEEVPDLRFRLAELYADKARDYFFRAQERDDAIARAQTENEKAALRAAQSADMEESRAWSRSALDAYAKIRSEHPDYSRMPEVLFALGQAHWTAGEFQAALQPYADLITTYPDHPLVQEAWLAFGEYYFNEGDIRKALQSYQKAAADRYSRVYGFAVYKQGWCYYNMAEWQDALTAFRTTVLYAQMAEELSGENKLALGREAQRDWVRTYVHTGSADRARADIMSLLGVETCGERCGKLLEGLAGLWFDEGYFAESASVYRQLVRMQPDSLRNPLRQAKVVDLIDRMGEKEVTVQAAEELVAIFGAARARMAALAEGTEPRLVAESDMEEASIVAETTLRRLAQEWNREARKTRQDQTLVLAEKMYASYLAVFPDHEAAYGMRFQYADLLYKLERFDQAAKQYRAVVEAAPDDGKHRVEAANDNILAVEEHLRDLGLELPTGGTERRDLHPQHQRLVDAGERYLRLVSPEAAKETRPAVLLKVARVHYAYNQFPEALERFERLVEESPRTEQAVVAANLVVDIHNLEKDWASLYEAARRYLDTPALVEGRPKLTRELERFGEYAKFALVQSKKEEAEAAGGDLSAVAEAFEAFAREFPRSENADEALFNASVIRDELGDKARASALRSRLLEQYPNSPLRADVAFYVAKRHQERTEYRAAAKALFRFAQEFPDDERARDALFDASVLYAGTGQASRAAAIRERYLKAFGRSDDAEAVAYAIAADLEQGRRFREAIRAYAAFRGRFRTGPRFFDALWREAKIRREHLRDVRGAEKLEGQLLASVRGLKRRGGTVPPNALRYASLVAVWRLEDARRDYERMRLRRPSLRNPRPFKLSIRDKARARDRLIAKYAAVVKDYAQAEASIVALHHMARAQETFATAFTSLGCPRGLDRDACDEFQAQLDEQAQPVLERAVERYASCVSTSSELKTYTEFSVACAKRLEVLAPQRMPPIEEMVLKAGEREMPTGRAEVIVQPPAGEPAVAALEGGEP